MAKADVDAGGDALFVSMPAPRMVSVNEAAALAVVQVREVHRAFQEKLLPDALRGGAGASRQVARGAVPRLAFYVRAAGIRWPSAG